MCCWRLFETVIAAEWGTKLCRSAECCGMPTSCPADTATGSILCSSCVLAALQCAVFQLHCISCVIAALQCAVALALWHPKLFPRRCTGKRSLGQCFHPELCNFEVKACQPAPQQTLQLAVFQLHYNQLCFSCITLHCSVLWHPVATAN